jgi:arylsulfatase A-like enzyme
VLDSLAAQGVRVDAAYSHNGYTAQSRHHLMTGSLAGLRGGTSLIDDFKAQGYAIGYFSGQDDSFGGAGLSVGAERADTMFDARQAKGERYSTFTTPGSLAVPASTVLNRVRGFLAAQSAEVPLFLYVNFHDTHFPYHHDGVPLTFTKTPLAESSIVPARREELRATYYNTAAYVDASIGELMNDVRQATGRSPAVVVVGDHGESLFDDTFLGHGYALNETQTRIPLIAAGIGLEIAVPFGQSDLRDAIGRALSGGTPTAAPVVRDGGAKRVFQYLGIVDRPRQIALRGRDGRISYDFRSRQVCLEARPCRPASGLDTAERARFHDLVHYWESMVVARSQVVSHEQ